MNHGSDGATERRSDEGASRRSSRAALALALLLAGCAAPGATRADRASDPFIVVLGIAQDAGAPQAGCDRACCAERWGDPARRRHAASLAIVDPASGERWLVEATPDLRAQLRHLDEVAPRPDRPGLDGVLVTHAHIGHYLGLAHLGHEAMGSDGVPLLVMPRMAEFLRTNGPWDQLVRLGNVTLRELAADEPVALSPRITVTPFRVPHREEYSEVAGFRIDGPRRSALFLPDIDKWERWERRIEDLIATVDVAWLDGTFFADGELPHRSMAEIPHPFIVESMQRFADLPPPQRAKIRFIHLNHTNPALDPAGDARRAIEAAGFAVAAEGERLDL